MYLLFDPYANAQWSMPDIRLVNKVADVLLDAHDHIDPSEIAQAIRKVYRPGMAAQPLLQHATQRLRNRADRAEAVVDYS